MGRNIALIPARGGSAGIMNKNIKLFHGKPLINWTIELAMQCSEIHRVIVSTDSPEIAEIAKASGAEVPFMRPSSIAEASTAIEPVLKHAYEWLIDFENYQAKSIALLFPTNPLRRLMHLESALNLFYEKNVDTVLTVNKSPAHYTPYWTLIKDANGKVLYFDGKNLRDGYVRRQDFPLECFAKNDLVFVINPENLYLTPPSIFGDKVELLETNIIFDGDINTLDDWDSAEITFEYLEKNEIKF
jgi:CMP-N-acetylneuraminic acid synthetase